MSGRPVDILLALLRGMIPGETSDIKEPEGIAWEQVLELSQRCKVSLLILQGLDALGDAVPATVRHPLANLQARCFHENMTSVASNMRVVRLLETHGIEALSLKGVLRSHEVYNRWDIRFAADIDLLVRASDYRSAAEVLEKNGYWAPIPSESDWWHKYLGESPFVPQTTSGPTIDLHHKLNQPGTPAFHDTEALFQSSVPKKFGGPQLRTLEPRAALLLAATSFGKALRQHEPCLTSLHEIAYVRASRPELPDDVLDDFARRHKVLRLWRQARETADALFRPSLAVGDHSLADLVVQDLVRGGAPPAHFHRTRLLWSWTDGSLKRPLRFARELGRVRASLMSHSAYERSMQTRSAPGAQPHTA
ncbi:MAG: nucleotidyltransferase family protein [Pseudomonadota bacterium]